MIRLPRPALSRNRQTALFASAAVVFLTLAILFCRAAGRAEERTAALAARKEADAFAAAPRAAPADSFAFPASDFLALPNRLRGGAQIEEVSEEPPQAEAAGDILKMKLTGAGNFAQVLSLFDIIQKKHWVSADLLRLEREGDRLAFELELCAYRSRGTYEEEKHRTDRSDGHGEEPRRKDSR